MSLKNSDALLGRVMQVLEWIEQETHGSAVAEAQCCLYLMKSLRLAYPGYQELPGIDLVDLEEQAVATMRCLRRRRFGAIATIVCRDEGWVGQVAEMN